ncbi:glycosyltransferase family 4 protein [Bacillus sp. AFS053548]|uniref:glycosyltransferase family 4 protein n=1 Tax=Bacillus sp. AFS053548 TaxID=2033505 RepID=UPI000BFB3C49|nr:glycosyltransferase family 4 protein [Bacillus sp. AFS053548]PGM56742.1 hypothetical protein CN946_09935 [Bacillus sp. AFS053548]
MKKIKILHIGPRLEVPGGITEFCKGIINHNLNDIKINFLGTSVSGDKNKMIKNIQFFASIIFFFRYMIFSNTKIVHIHSSSDSSFYRKSIFVLLSKLFKKNIIFHIHSGKFLEFYNKKSLFQRRFIKKILSICDEILVLTESWSQNIFNELKIKSKVLPNYIDGSLYKDTKLKSQFNEIKKIVYMGKICEHKGIYDVIDVVKHLKSKNISCKFIIAGNGSKTDINELNNLIENNSIEEYIEYVGWLNIKEKIELLSTSDIFILPSHIEAFGIVLLEAMHFGLPIVATEVGGIPEVVIKNKNALLVPAKSPIDLSKSIITLLENKDLFNLMSENNMNRSRQFEKEIVLEKLRNYYLSMRRGRSI